eukprot:symbB.v1.2.026066.t1/scaffold2579.1/size75843/1
MVALCGSTKPAQASAQETDVLVLPDAGCGVFKNDPQAVGSALGEALQLLGGAIDQIVVASPAPSGRICAEAANGLLNPSLSLPVVQWLYECERGFRPFAPDCQVTLEEGHKSFLQGGQQELWITSGNLRLRVLTVIQFC